MNGIKLKNMGIKLTIRPEKNINRKGLLIDSVSLTKQGDHDTSNYKINFGSNETPEVYKNVIGFRLVKATLPRCFTLLIPK